MDHTGGLPELLWNLRKLCTLSPENEERLRGRTIRVFLPDLDAVSYTHLDVYKRQKLHGAFALSCAGLLLLTEAACWQGQNRNPARLVPGGIFALCFLLLLCYCLLYTSRCV